MYEADRDDAAPQASLIAHGLRPEQLAAYRAEFDIFVLDDSGASPVLRHGSNAIALDYPPQAVVAVVTAGASPEVADWMATMGVDAPLVAHAEALPGLLAALARRSAGSARFAADLVLRLAALRVVHENLQNAHEGLRSFVQERGMALPMLGFLALPDPDSHRLPPQMAEVTQTIPCDIRMLRAVSLHLPDQYLPEQSGAPGEGLLQVSLLSPENPDLSVEWNVAYAALRSGWTSFVFDGVGPAVPSGALLRLRFRTQAGVPPRFSLARHNLRPDRAAAVDGERLGRPLAFRAWTSVPGAPLTLTAQLWPAIYPGAAQPAVARIELLATDDFEVEDVRGLAEKLDFRPVRKLPRQRRILLHPLGRLPTVGRIPNGCPQGTLEIRVEVETDHAEAAAIEYGVCLNAVPELDAAGAPTGNFNFDGPADWAVLPAKTPGTLVVSFDEPLAEAADLYLVSRCPPGSISDWGWAHVIRLTLLGHFQAAAFQPFVAVP
jgi:Family of unknown function (DUF6212)